MAPSTCSFRTVALVLIASVAHASAAASGSGSIAAVQKVIGMLQDMTAKAKQEKKDEEVAFGKFQTWCKLESANLKEDIKQAGERIELLGASIDKLGSDIKNLGEEIMEHKQTKAKHESDMQAEKDQRAKDHEAFLAEEQDYSESVDAIDRALTIMQKENYDRPGAAAALLQVSNGRLPEKARSLVAAFVDMLGGDSPLGGTDYEAPQANAYEFQSGGIIELLKKLQDDFRSQLGQCQKEEMNAKHAHDMSVQDHEDIIENNARAASEKTQEKDRKAEEKAQNEKQKKATEEGKAADENTLSEMTTECTEKSMSFQEKQQLRTEEIEAMAKAIEILSSDDVSGMAQKHLELAQASSGVALVQSSGESMARLRGVHRRVREFLLREGQRLKSKQITLLAEKLMADPFAKVKKMIDAMITRLLEEANQDAQHEGFCDTELGKNKVTRTKLSQDIDALTAATESGKATIAELQEETARLSAEVADLDKSMGEATELRKADKAKNEETIADSQAAQKAVAAATAVLKDFYAKASTATAFVQEAARAPAPSEWGLKTRVKMGSDEWNSLANPNFEGTVDKGHKEGMQTFGEREEGQQDRANYGVIGLLEVIASDFANLEADTNSAEAAAAEAYERFMVESKKSKATKEQKIELNNADQAAAEAKLHEDTADLKATQDELLAADRVYEKLVPQCMDQGMTWEERVAARQAEIDSLKEALKLLSMSDIA